MAKLDNPNFHIKSEQNKYLKKINNKLAEMRYNQSAISSSVQTWNLSSCLFLFEK